MKNVVVNQKYRLGALLFEDMISYCYEGVSINSDLKVMVWVYKSDYLNDQLVEQCLILSERVSRVRDPYVLQLWDYHYDGKYFYSVYEYISGLQSLENYIKSVNKPDLKKLWRFSTEVLSALIKLESRRIRHGQVNMNGVFITPDGHVKLAKSGVALAIIKANFSSLSVLDDCMFYPPEFIQDQRYILQSEIYSYGVLLYVMFSGKWPYKETLDIETYKKSLVDAPQPFVKVSDRVPEKLKLVVDLCLQANPYDRFTSFVNLVKGYKGETTIRMPDKGDNHIRLAIEEALQASKVRRMKRWLWGSVFAFLVIGAFGLMSLVYTMYLTSIPEKKVPEVVGIPFEDAMTMLQQEGLDSWVVGSRVHASYEKGVVIETKPPAGRAVKQHRRIRLFVSKGVGPVLVPDLIGRSREQAEDILVQRGLTVEVATENFSLQYPEGAIISQEPTPNTFILPSENITVIVSKGFPVTLDVQPAKSSFFSRKSHLMAVRLTCDILNSWTSQEISIYFTIHKQREKIYSDVHQPGEHVDLSFDLESGGTLEVFFDDDLAISKQIQVSD